MALALAGAAFGQVTPDAVRDQARRSAASDAAARAALANAPQSKLELKTPAGLGVFPVESPCFTVRQTVVDGALPRQLGWVKARLAKFRGRCVGHEGLNYILKALERDFLNRGLVTTRAGLPEQDLSRGVLHVAVVPGVVAGLKGGSAKTRRGWNVAAPLHKGDLVNLRALEQGLDQVRRIPGAQVQVDLAPGAAPGDTELELTAKAPRVIGGSLSVNSFAGPTVGDWQGAAQLAAQDVLGLNEVLTVFVNSRIESPSIPANSNSTGANFYIPWGWWTFGVNASENFFSQEITGQNVTAFTTSNRLQTLAVSVEDVFHRDRTSKTSLQLQVQRRLGRAYVDGAEIGLQHQDLTDIQVAILDKRNFGQTKLSTTLSYRQGVGLFGELTDLSNSPNPFLSPRYGIATLDMALEAHGSDKIDYTAAFRGQIADAPVIGADLFSVGGPYTVRGYDSNRAILDRSGWYLRQDVSYRLTKLLSPYALLDMGGVGSTGDTPIGMGGGLRFYLKGFQLDGFFAAPLNPVPLASQRVKFGLSTGFNF